MSSPFLKALDERVLILDGAMGTSVQNLDLPEEDYRGCENCPEVILLSRPDKVRDIHRTFLSIGSDGVETNTFGANQIVLAEFGMADQTRELNRIAATLAREAADEFSTPERPRFVIGSMGPGTQLPSLRQTTWDILRESYAEQARGLLDGGADALLIETCQDILQAKSALAGVEAAIAEHGSRVPIMVQVTMETTGTMLVGSDMAAAVTALEAFPQIDVIGLNCATGPREMSEHVRYLAGACTRKLSVMPNAGLPQLVDGKPHYALTPAELAKWLLEFVEEDGVNLVGGCCGTTPAHIEAVVKAIGTRAPKQRQPDSQPTISSIYLSTTIEQDNSFLIIGERTNANGSKKFRELLAAEDVDGMVQMAREQVKGGSHAIDVCGAYVGRDERVDMERIVSRFANDVKVPLVIDSTDPDVIEASLKLAGGKNVINSINLEDGEERLDCICELARRFGAAVIALTIDEEGMAKTADRKLAVAQRIHDLATKRHGIAAGDLLFDPLTFTICTGNEDDQRLGVETLEGIRLIKENLPGVHTMLGLSNISFGIKAAARRVLNSVYLHYAREAGLDAAIVHATGITPLFKIDEAQREAARRLIFAERVDGDPLIEFIGMFENVSSKSAEKKKVAVTVEERLKERIIDGDRTGLEADLDEALAKHAPLDIINTILLDGMKVVGELFGSGQMQLPFVLQSAETMKASVAHLEPHMERTEGSSKGKIVLATVRGDVHDIGKNLVDIILTNNGYTVFNLGIRQPIGQIVDAYQSHGADAIGMSGLLVKSTQVMKDDLEVLNEQGLAPPVILGGAALTRKYVEKDLRGIYKGPLFYAKDAFEGLHLMDEVMSGDVTAAVGAGSQRVSDASGDEQQVAVVAPPQRSDVSTNVPVPTPPFWGSRVVERLAVDSLVPYLNEVMLFQVQWNYKKARRSAEVYEAYLKSDVRPILRDVLKVCREQDILKPQMVYGYWPCWGEGNDLVLFDPEDQDREISRMTFPRQKKKPWWCISDFFRPPNGGEKDVVAFTAVTMGSRVSEVARAWFEEDRYLDYFHLHGLGVELAEALAEYAHRQVRMELGIANADARDMKKLFQQGYQGSRFSFGYPACPRLEDQAALWPLLEPERIGLSLSEEFELVPEQSTTALVCHHPEARYFKA